MGAEGAVGGLDGGIARGEGVMGGCGGGGSVGGYGVELHV